MGRSAGTEQCPVAPRPPAARRSRRLRGAMAGHSSSSRWHPPQCRKLLSAALVLGLVLTLAPAKAIATAPGAETDRSVGAAEGPQPVVAAPGAAASAASPPPPPPSEKFSLIIVFRDASSLAALRAMCNPSPMLYRLFHRGLGLPADCHMPGMCRRIYTETIVGGWAGLRVTGGHAADSEGHLEGLVSTGGGRLSWWGAACGSALWHARIWLSSCSGRIPA